MKFAFTIIMILSSFILQRCNCFLRRSYFNSCLSRTQRQCLRFFGSNNENDEMKSTDKWDNWEYGTFRTYQHQNDHEDEVSVTGSLEKQVDPMWKDLNDAEVQLGIDTLREFCSDDRLNKMQQVLAQRTSHIRVVFENPGNANNMWAALRTFDSFGLQFVDIIIDKLYYTTEWRSKTMKTALGSQKWLTLQEHSSTLECIDHFRSLGYKIYASDLHDRSRSVHDIDWLGHVTGTEMEGDEINKEKIVIVMGNEETGITETMRQHADGLFYIPMKGFAESLNLSVASAVMCAILDSKGALYPNIESQLKNRIMLTWLLRSVKGSLPLLRRAGLQVSGNSRYNKIGNITTNP